MNICYSDFCKICRFCLKYVDGLQSIFGEFKLVDVIHDYLGVKVRPIDDLPNSICTECLCKLIDSYAFRDQCKKNQQILEMAREARSDHDVDNESVDKMQPNSLSNDAISTDTDRTNKSQKSHRKQNELTKANSRLKQIQDAQKSICPICGTLQKYMRQHMVIHTGDRRFECTYCKKRFLQLGCLRTHLNIHTGNKPFSCNHCDKCFSDASGLRLHKLSHSEDRNYTCETCQKKFRYIHNLSQHRRTHTQERRHHCQYCKGSFLTTSALKKHVMLHTGERKYKCDICTKGFITNYNLNIHRKVHFKKTTKLGAIDDSQLIQAKPN